MLRAAVPPYIARSTASPAAVRAGADSRLAAPPAASSAARSAATASSFPLLFIAAIRTPSPVRRHAQVVVEDLCRRVAVEPGAALADRPRVAGGDRPVGGLGLAARPHLAADQPHVAVPLGAPL